MKARYLAWEIKKAKIDKFKRSLPRTLSRYGSRSRAPTNNQRSEAAAALPALRSRWGGAVRAMDQQQVWHINLQTCDRRGGDQ
jgi:hypothetical protein